MLHAATVDCPFCRIADGADLDVRPVYSDTHTIAFFPDEPAILGHTLVIPRMHIPDLWTLTPDAAQHLTRAVLAVATAVRTALQPDGMNLIQSNGLAATQTVPHLHVHILPRWEGDSFGAIWPEAAPLGGAAMDAAAAAIRAASSEQGPR